MKRRMVRRISLQSHAGYIALGFAHGQPAQWATNARLLGMARAPSRTVVERGFARLSRHRLKNGKFDDLITTRNRGTQMWDSIH